jgi:predicted aspartyl protease
MQMDGRRRGILLTAVWMAASAAVLVPPVAAQSPGSTGAVCAAQTHAAAEPAATAPGRPDWLLREQRFSELARWVAEQQNRLTATPADLAVFRGILANRQNQNAASIALLIPLLPHLDPVADSAHFRLVLNTLADDYTKTYRYGDAADALMRLQRQAPASMSAEDRRDLGNSVAVRNLLRDAPRQRVLNSQPFTVPLRRDTIGLREVSVRAGADSAWWIFDTGANFSTISESMARRLGLHVSSGAATVKGTTGAATRLKVAVIPELRIAAARVSNVVVLVLADSALDIPAVHFQISAILGYPVLEALDRLAITPDQVQVTPDPDDVPSDSSNMFLDELNPLVAVTVDGASRFYHFDSGADATVLGVHFCRAYPQLLAGLSPRPVGIGGAGGTSAYSAYLLTHLPVTVGGTSTILDSVSVISDSSTMAFEPSFGNLGQDLASSRGGYTIDFRAMTFRLGTGDR